MRIGTWSGVGLVCVRLGLRWSGLRFTPHGSDPLFLRLSPVSNLSSELRPSSLFCFTTIYSCFSSGSSLTSSRYLHHSSFLTPDLLFLPFPSHHLTYRLFHRLPPLSTSPLPPHFAPRVILKPKKHYPPTVTPSPFHSAPPYLPSQRYHITPLSHS